ncbi:MAG TPA: hypothetical protein VFX59_28145 [Polyangiales bacterium]|nr:hypothetical protein [Polyangiales bacterium]
MKTLAFRSATRSGIRFMVLLHSPGEPDLEEWSAYLREVKAMLSLNGELVHTFVATDGGGPIAAQRKGLADVIQACVGDLLTHVFTRDPFVRGIVTAFRWIARSKAVAHTPEEFEQVCAELGLSPHQVLEVFGEAQRTFTPVETLAQLHKHTKPKRTSLARR